MATIPDIQILSSSFTDINTASGIVAGTKIKIINKGNVDVLLYESTTQPSDDENNGFPLTTLPSFTSQAIILEGSDTIWAKALSQRSWLSIQEV